MRQLWLAILVCSSTACASRPMFVGPPSSLPGDGARATVGATWAKPLQSSDVGVPQLDAALHLPVSSSFDLAVRAWSLGGGIQARIPVVRRSAGGVFDVMVAPLVGVSTVVDHGEEGDERLIPPIDVGFLVSAPIAVGLGVGLCSVFVGPDPVLHLRPDIVALRAAVFGGFSCPTKSGQVISPELAFELPVIGADAVRPEDGYEPGARRHPLLAQVVRLGVAFSF